MKGEFKFSGATELTKHMQAQTHSIRLSTPCYLAHEVGLFRSQNETGRAFCSVNGLLPICELGENQAEAIVVVAVVGVVVVAI